MRLRDDATALVLAPGCSAKAGARAELQLISPSLALPHGAPYSIFIPVRATTFFESL